MGLGGKKILYIKNSLDLFGREPSNDNLFRNQYPEKGGG